MHLVDAKESRLIASLTQSHERALATLQSHPGHVQLVGAMHELLCDFIEGDDNEERSSDSSVHDLSTLATFAYWAAARSVIECHTYGGAGHIRSALEAALYAARCKANPDAAKLWRGRHSEFEAYMRRQRAAGRTIDYEQGGVLDARSRKAMRSSFTIDACIKAVLSLHEGFKNSRVRVSMEKRIRNLYDSRIDFGAHPNILQAQLAEPQERYMKPFASPAQLRLQMSYDRPERLSWSLLDTVEAGSTLALIVGIVLPERVHPLRAEERLDEIAEQARQLGSLPSSTRAPRHPALKR